MNPYQRSIHVDVPINRLGSLAAEDGAEPLSGHLHGALAVLKDQRREWYESLSAQARVRSVSQLTILGLSATAIYNGLKSGVASDGDKRRLALAGAAGFATYTAGNWFINSSQEDAYVEGIRTLTCSMQMIEPLRMDLQKFAVLTADQLSLTVAINDLDRALLQAQALVRYADGDASAPAKVRKEAGHALWLARKTLASSHQLSRELDNSGVTLMREGDLAFARVAAIIKASNRDVSSPESHTGAMAGVIAKFRAVSIEPKSEAAGDPTTQTTPTVPGPKADRVGDKPKDSAVGADKTPLANASATALIDQLSARLKQQFDAATAALQAALDKQLAATSRAREQAQAVAKITAANASDQLKAVCIASGRNDCELLPDATATNLATLTASVYARRRPLSNQLLAFHQARKAALSNGNCVRGGSAMSVSPLEDAEVEAGAIHAITVSGVAVAPTVNVKGQATVERVVGPGPNEYVVRIQVADKAVGVIDVSISDRGLAAEQIVLTVIAPKAANQ
jgi:hypothetical protein